MKLVPEWKRILFKAWSVRLAMISAVLSAAEFALPYIAPAASSRRFAALAAVVSLAAAVGRIVAQPKLWK